MKVNYQLAGLIFALSFLPALSHATIVDGSFTGSITNARDEGDTNNDYLNFFSEDIADQTVSGSFWYDTELAPPQDPSSPGRYSFDTQISPVKWFDFTLFVDGKTLSISDDHPAGYEIFNSRETIRIDDNDDPTQWAYGDHMSIRGSRVARDSEGNDSLHAGGLQIKDPHTDFIDGFGLVQDFSWSRSGQDEWGIGSYETKGIKDGQPFYAFVSLDISTVNLSPRAVSVPEPSSLILFGLGLLGLAARYRQTKFINKK